MAAYHQVMTNVTCRLTAKNRDQLWNPTLGNLVWATFTFFNIRFRTVVSNEKQALFFTVTLCWDRAPYAEYLGIIGVSEMKLHYHFFPCVLCKASVAVGLAVANRRC